MKSEKMKNLFLVEHPLIKYKLAILRDKNTEHKTFRELVSEIAMLLTFSATRTLKTKKVEIETPIAISQCETLENEEFVIAPILRAGLSMVDGVLKLLPTARVAHIGLYRNEKTCEPVKYFFKMPQNLKNPIYFLLDPMLATASSAIYAVDLLKENGINNIKFINIIASEYGVERFLSVHPDVEVYTASVDKKLNDRNYIVPGLGDAGDRIFGTI